MQQWECIVCGWIYDESVGDPDSGIAPGTKFEDIPDDWMCPECGVGKDDFELVDIPVQSASPAFTQSQPQVPAPAITSSLNEDPIVIIGSGLAGYGLLKELRKSGNQIPIVVITSDDGRSYSKPALSTGYTKNTSADDLTQMDAGGIAAQYGASVWTMTEVTSIDTSSKTISINNGSASLRYSKLVLALGAQCIEPPIEGNALDQLYSINDLMDFAQFQNAAAQKKAKKICVIGAGLIGCEYTNDLINGGFEVGIVDPLGSCLPTLLPEVAGNAVKSALQDQGATFHFGKTVVAVSNSESSGVDVELNDGSVLQADLVVSAVGVRPQINLAQQSGISVKRGIQTNSLLETSASDVYALGDCAEVEGLVLVYVAPLVAGVRALAKTLNGEPTPVAYPPMPIAVKTPACPVVVCPPSHGAIGEWVTIQEENNNVYAEFRSDDDSLLGFALTGNYISEKGRLQKELPNLL